MPPVSLSENVVETASPNGTVVLTEGISHVASVSVGIWVKAGSRFESESEAGLSHFLEHVFFKGTPKRTAQQIAEEMDAVGGQLDASTSREYTCFHSRVLVDHLPLAADIMSDIILNSRFKEEDVAREKEVILEEIRAYEDDPAEVVMDQLMRSLFGSHPVGRPILGRQEIIRSATPEILKRYRGVNYTAPGLVLAAAGGIRHEEILVHFERLLKELPPGEPDRRGPAPAAEAGRRVSIKQQEQVHLALGAPAVPFNHPSRYALMVLNNMLGGGLSSRLFQEVREKRGLAYSVFSSVELLRDSGVIYIHTACEPDKFDAAVSVIGGILSDMAAGRIPDAEVVRSREQLRSSMFLGLESTANRMVRMAFAKMYLGEVPLLSHVLGKLESVSPDDVRGMARDLLSPGRFAVSILGPGSAGKYAVPWAPAKECVAT